MLINIYVRTNKSRDTAHGTLQTEHNPSLIAFSALKLSVCAVQHKSLGSSSVVVTLTSHKSKDHWIIDLMRHTVASSICPPLPSRQSLFRWCLSIPGILEVIDGSFPVFSPFIVLVSLTTCKTHCSLFNFFFNVLLLKVGEGRGKGGSAQWCLIKNNVLHSVAPSFAVKCNFLENSSTTTKKTKFLSETVKGFQAFIHRTLL